jgi:hypothetical protein
MLVHLNRTHRQTEINSWFWYLPDFEHSILASSSQVVPTWRKLSSPNRFLMRSNVLHQEITRVCVGLSFIVASHYFLMQKVQVVVPYLVQERVVETYYCLRLFRRLLALSLCRGFKFPYRWRLLLLAEIAKGLRRWRIIRQFSKLLFSHLLMLLLGLLKSFIQMVFF